MFRKTLTQPDCILQPMPLDSIPGIKKVTERHRALFILWTKYGKWELEGHHMFTERIVRRQDGHLRAP